MGVFFMRVTLARASAPVEPARRGAWARVALAPISRDARRAVTHAHLGRTHYDTTLEVRMPQTHAIARLILVTPFAIESSAGAEEVEIMRGCPLCQITHDMGDRGATVKEDFRAWVDRVGVPVEVVPRDRASGFVLDAVGETPPAVVAETEDGAMVQLLGRDGLARCSGSVADFRGRIRFQAARHDLRLPEPGISV